MRYQRAGVNMCDEQGLHPTKFADFFACPIKHVTSI